MSRKRHKPEEIVAKLRQVDVLLAQGHTVADAIRSIGVTEVVVIESWRVHYNTVRPHASLGYRPPAPEVFVPGLAARSAAQPWPASPAALPLAPRPILELTFAPDHSMGADQTCSRKDRGYWSGPACGARYPGACRVAGLRDRQADRSRGRRPHGSDRNPPP